MFWWTVANIAWWVVQKHLLQVANSQEASHRRKWMNHSSFNVGFCFAGTKQMPCWKSSWSARWENGGPCCWVSHFKRPSLNRRCAITLVKVVHLYSLKSILSRSWMYEDNCVDTSPAKRWLSPYMNSPQFLRLVISLRIELCLQHPIEGAFHIKFSRHAGTKCE